MNNEKLISQQALQIATLEERIKEYDSITKKIHNIIYCIGGPLNDNKLMYTQDQKKPFLVISELIEI